MISDEFADWLWSEIRVKQVMDSCPRSFLAVMSVAAGYLTEAEVMEIFDVPVDTQCRMIRQMEDWAIMQRDELRRAKRGADTITDPV